MDFEAGDDADEFDHLQSAFKGNQGSIIGHMNQQDQLRKGA
jgi:hypothetical protein